MKAVGGAVMALLVSGIFNVHASTADNEGQSAARFRYFSRTNDASNASVESNVQARVQLGKLLFFDPRLSASQIVSCATCHNPALSWSDGQAKGVGDGMKRLSRRTPPVHNLAWASRFFWDGRASTLEEQALEAIEAPSIMNVPRDLLVSRVTNIGGYRPYFQVAFPREGITAQSIVQAIAAYERTIVSGTAPFDRWIAGDPRAMPDSAIRGFRVFTDAGHCSECHGTWRFTDDSFNDIGLPDADIGGAQLLVQGGSQPHTFKTPGLRNVELRAPYMHDGSLASLADVVDYYDKGGAVRRPGVAAEVRPLHLTAQEKTDLVSFLRSLTSDDAPVIVPRLPR